MSQSTIVSVGNTPTANGGGWSSHAFYAVNSGRYWVLTLESTSTTTLYSYYSSDGVNWSAGATFTLAGATTDGRNLAVVYQNISSTDVVHVSYTHSSATSHVRATISGTTITYGSNVTDSSTSSVVTPAGNAACIDSTGRPIDVIGGGSNGDTMVGGATNVDSGSAWTTGFGTLVNSETGTNNISSACAIQLSTGYCAVLVDDAAGASPPVSLEQVHAGKIKNTTGTITHTTAGSWLNVFTALGASQNANTWNAVRVSDSDVHVILASSTNTWTHKRIDCSVASTAVPTAGSAGSAIGNQTFNVTGGVAMITDGTTIWLFCIDSASGNDIKINSWTSGGGWAGWTSLGLASATRNYLTCSAQMNGTNVQLYWVEGTANPWSLCSITYNTSSVTNYTRTAATTVTPVNTATRLLAAARAAVTSVAPINTATRVILANRAALSTVAPINTATRVRSVPRTAATTVAPVNTAQRATAAQRAATTTVAPITTATRQAGALRQATTSVAPSTLATRMLAAFRTALTAVAPINTSTWVRSVPRTASTSVAPVNTATRQTTAQRAASTTVAPVNTATRVRSVPSAASTSVAPINTATYVRGAARQATTSVAPINTAARLLTAGRAALTTVAPITLATRLAAYLRAAVTSVAPVNTATNAHGLPRTASTTVAPINTATRVVSRGRAATTTVAPITLAGRIAGYLRQAITAVLPQNLANRVLTPLPRQPFTATDAASVLYLSSEGQTIVFGATDSSTLQDRASDTQTIVDAGSDASSVVILSTDTVSG